MANELINPNQQRESAINSMYDAQKQQQLNELETAYKQSRASAQTAADKIPEQYQAQANDLATQYERNRRNLNTQAAGNGINTGTGSQMALALNNRYQQNMGGLRTSQAEAQTAADRQMADLEARYKSEVASAIASNDLNRAKALYDEYNNAEERLRADAKNLAGYGDFSGYNQLYTQLYGADRANDIVGNMQSLWRAQNPDIAYFTGQMTAEEYRNLTGQYPAGYSAPGSGYGPAVPAAVKGVAADTAVNGVREGLKPQATETQTNERAQDAFTIAQEAAQSLLSGDINRDQYNAIIANLNRR